MKRHLHKYLILLVLLLSAFSQLQAQDAYYIYTRGGGLQVFYTDLVDSMTVSKYDIDSIEHEEIVTQAVWTNDTVYTFAIANIDSISFVTPETVYQSNVINLADGLDQYVSACDGLTITLSGSTPNRLLPRKGNKLVYLETTDLFPKGFAGEVSDIVKNSDSYTLVCQLTSLSSIFKRYYSPGLSKTASNSYAAKAKDAPRKVEAFGSASWHPQPLIFPMTSAISRYITSPNDVTYTINPETELTISLTPSMEFRASLIITPETGTYVSFTTTSEYKLQEHLALSGSLSREVKPLSNLTHVAIPLPNCPLLSVYVEPGAFLRASLDTDLELTGEQTIKSSFCYNWSSRGDAPLKNSAPTWRLTNHSFRGEGSVKGTLQGGCYLEVGLEITDVDITKIYLNAEAGLQLEGNTTINSDDLKDCEQSTTAYELLRNAQITISRYWGAGFGAEVDAKFFKAGASMDFTSTIGAPLLDWKLAPDFSEIVISNSTETAHGINLESEISGSSIPLETGFRIHNALTNDLAETILVGKYAHTEQQTMTATFTKWAFGKLYTAYPFIKLFGREILASPSVAIEVAVTPHTDDTTDFTHKDAVLKGHLEGDTSYLDSSCTYGFYYGTDDEPAANGTKVSTTLDENGMMNATVSNLTGTTTYYYQAFIEAGGEYTYGEVKSFTTPLPVEIVKFETTGATYYPDQYTYNGNKYSFKYNGATYVKITDDTNVEDWGYELMEPDGSSAQISLKAFGRNSVKDTRYAYCRNAPTGTVRLRGYARYANETEAHFGEWQEYALAYPEESSLTMTGCEYKGTVTDAVFNDYTYQYKSSFRISFTAEGAYWLTVGTKESGEGWDNWNNLPDDVMRPVDGSNALTVNYYYDDKSVAGDLNVYLLGTDKTHGTTCTSQGYASYLFTDGQLSGCTFHAASNAAKQLSATVTDAEETPIYNKVINKTSE